MTDQKPEPPQDADTTQAVTSSTQRLPAHGPDSAAWTTWVPTSAQHPTPTAHTEGAWSPPKGGTSWTPPPVPPMTGSDTPTPAAAAPAPAQAHAPSPSPTTAPTPASAPAPAPKPHVTYLPPPSGPNWGLVIVGLVFGLVGAGVVANQVAGFEVSSLSEAGPSVLVIVGLVCALLGIVGILTRRRRG
jgi:LPXTG-motif cell wall-anchored protein